MAKDYEISAVDRAVSDKLASRAMLDAVTDAIKTSISETSQRANVNMADLAESVVNVFKNDLRSSVSKFCEDWVEQNGMLQVVPPNTKLLKRIGNYQVCVVEQPPMVRSLVFANERTAGGADGTFRVALPYVVFVVWLKDGYFHKAFVGYSTKPLSSINDVIHAPNLPNVHNGLGICMGNSWGDKVAKEMRSGKSKPLATAVEEVINHFWSSIFNNDLGDYFVRCAGSIPQVKSLQVWSQNSTENPLFVLKVKWPENYALRNFLVGQNEGEGLNIKIGSVVDRAITNAGQQLQQQLLGISKSVAATRAVSVFRSKLHEILSQMCFDILASVSSRNKEEIRRDLEAELRAKGPALENNVTKVARYEGGDYLYHPPSYGVW